MVKIKNYIATKTFYKQVAIIAIPIILQQFLSNAAQFVDSVMVGSLGSNTIAGVAASNQIFFIANSTLFGINMAGAIFISQFLGSHNNLKIKETVRISYLLSMIWMVIVFLFLQFFPHIALRFFLTDAQAIIAGSKYIKLVSLSYLPLAISISTAIGFRAIGKTIYPMYIGIITLLVNTTFNYLFIYGNFGFPKMGVEGAAFATVLARFVELFVTFILVYNLKPITAIRPSTLFHFSKDLLKKIVEKAIPIFANEFLWAFGMTALVTLAANRITDDLTAVAISNTIGNLFYVAMSGLASAVAVIVGKSLGANQLQSAKKYANQLIFMATVIALGISMLILITSFVAPDFYDVSTEIRENARKLLQTIALFYPIFMFNAGIFFVIRAGGDTLSAAIMDSGMMWLIQVPLAFLLVYFTELSMVERYFIVQASNILKLVIALHFYRKGHWIRNLTLEVE